jgi:hypothetical protein
MTKLKSGELFETEDGKPLKLSGLAIIEKGRKPIIYKAAMHSKTTWTEWIHSFVTDDDFDAGRNVMVVVDDNSITPTLKPLGYLTKTTEFGSYGGSIATIEITDRQWGVLKTIPGLTLYQPGKSIEVAWMGKFNREFTDMLEDQQIKFCDLNIGGDVLPNVVGVMGVPDSKNNPKADLVFVSLEDR